MGVATEMKELLGQMGQLLADPQPGLSTWQLAVRQVGNSIKSKSMEF